MKLNEFCSSFKEKLETSNKIIILPHVSADGDALGSSIALANFLKERDKNARVVAEEGIPDKYDFIDNYGVVEVYAEDKEYESDMQIAVDTGDFERLGLRKSLFNGYNTWNIDHHKTNDGYAKFNCVDTEASSTGEIIYKILKSFGYEPDKATAEAIFTAISTDTGGLRYSNTTPESMRICADLLEKGINISEISHVSFDMMPYPKVLLLGRAIENMKIYHGGDIAVITLKKDDYAFLNGKEEYFDGIVNTTVNTEGVLAGALIRETGEGLVKVNLRSATDEIDVSALAQENGGGGHIRAAGYIEKNRGIEQSKTYILEYFGKILKKNEN